MTMLVVGRRRGFDVGGVDGEGRFGVPAFGLAEFVVFWPEPVVVEGGVVGDGVSMGPLVVGGDGSGLPPPTDRGSLSPRVTSPTPLSTRARRQSQRKMPTSFLRKKSRIFRGRLVRRSTEQTMMQCWEVLVRKVTLAKRETTCMRSKPHPVVRGGTSTP